VKGQDAPAVYDIELPLPSSVLHPALLSLGAIQRSPLYRITRSALWENFSYATGSGIAPPFPFVADEEDPNLPVRAPKAAPGSIVYSRMTPHLDEFFQLNAIHPVGDLNEIHEWMNDDRVDKFWMEKGSIEAHKAFIEGRVKDKHTLAVIGSYIPTGEMEVKEKATYAEIYWVKEDNLAPLMEKEGNPARNYDRGLSYVRCSYVFVSNRISYRKGIHVLVGSNDHRGPHRVRVWLPSLVHYCFLSDPRTERVIAEPNQLNTKMIQVSPSLGAVLSRL
jgi:hypothetical protein